MFFISKHAYRQCIRAGSWKWHVGCFFWPRKNAQAFSSMFGERSFLNFFRDSRTLLASVRDNFWLLFCYCSIFECWDDMVQYEFVILDPSTANNKNKLRVSIAQNRNIFTYHRLYERLVLGVVTLFLFTNCLM